MSKKVLTISIAAYNVAPFLKNTLESLIIPNEERLEVLIVNDGSTDETSQIGLEYEKKYPDIFKLVNKENGGYGSTINKSVKLATGKYFKQLDGDDWYCKENLKIFLDQLEQSESDCIYTPFYQVFEGTNKKDYFSLENNIDNGVYDIESIEVGLIDELLTMHTLTFKTCLLTNNNISILENCFYTDQEYILYPFIYAKDIEILDIAIYCYRLGLGEQSVSINGMRRHFRDHHRVVGELLNHYDEIESCTENKKNAIFKRMANLTAKQYLLFLIAPRSKKVKRELIQFNKSISKYYKINRLSIQYEVRVVKLLKKTNFILYPILSIYMNIRTK